MTDESRVQSDLRAIRSGRRGTYLPPGSPLARSPIAFINSIRTQFSIPRLTPLSIPNPPKLTPSGFITPEAGGDDVFCHFSAISDGNMLDEGSRVEYDESFDERKGKGRAENVTGGARGDDRGPPPPRDNTCRDFQRGNCTRDNCRFTHEGGGGGGGGGYGGGGGGGYGGDRGGGGGDNRGAPISAGVCYDWQKGRCSRQTCRFSHDGASEIGRAHV